MGILILIMLCIVVFDYVINRYLMRRLQIENSSNKYINRIHKYVENSLYIIAIVLIVISVTDFESLRIFTFVTMAIMFAFRAIMQILYEKERKTYIHSVVTLGLIVIGTIIYGVLDMNA